MYILYCRPKYLHFSNNEVNNFNAIIILMIIKRDNHEITTQKCASVRLLLGRIFIKISHHSHRIEKNKD